MFYLERAVEEVLSEIVSILYPSYFILKFLADGDGSAPETDMFAKFPRTPTDSTPPTPGGPRRRIRCKMCR
jgi:dual specificity phosphatase 12